MPAADALQELLDTVRDSATPALWSKGVELARQDAVSGEPGPDGELRLSVKPGTGQPNVRVSLFLDDGDWQCSCRGKDDPCAHVAAAVIAAKRALERGEAAPTSRKAGGKLAYRWHREDGALKLQRVIKQTGAPDVPLSASLMALVSGRVPGPAVIAEEQDLDVDRALSEMMHSGVSPRTTTALCRALAGIEGVTLDGKDVRVNATPVGVRLVIEDDGPGVRTRGEQDPAITETFSNGIALCGDVLRPISLPDLSPVERPLVQPGRFFGRQEFSYLVGELLPTLGAKVPVDVRTNQLPQLVRLKPEAELDLAAAGDTLVVTPGVTYMEPDGRVVARVRDGHCLTYGAAVPARDLGAESACWRELARFVPTDVPSLSLRGGEAVRFVASLGRFSGHVVGDGERQFTVEGDLHGTLSLSNDAADATFATSGFAGSTSKRADAAAVCAAWQAGDDVVRLDGGGFARLPADWLARYGDLVLDILAARTSAGGRPPRARLIAWAAAAADLPDSVDAGLRQLLAGLNDQGPLTTTVPLTVEPRPYQRLGIDWLLRRRAAGLGAILADDMGLGKTLQAIAAMPGDGRTLVVAPTSVLPNWQAELQRFRPELSVTLHHGGDRDTEAIAAGPGVVVTSYALLRLDADALARMTWDYVVFDEAHALKNADSQVAASAARLSAKARVGLTGTPVENRLEDLWSEMRVIAPGLFPSLAEFRERYSRRISQDDGGRAAERLRAVLQPFLLRRLKRDVAPELPQRTDAVLRLALSDEERRLYDALHATTKREALAKLGESDVLGALEALLRLRQACCHPSLVPGRHAASSSKVDTLVANLEELVADGHKALVFSQWTGLLDLIEPPLRDAGIAHLRLDGSTSDRGAIVDRFQSPAGPPVLIMSLKAGGVGLNLTAADHVFIMDPWWNPAAEDQAADRAHRIGQTRPVLVHRLVAHDTVEEKILVLQEKKRALADVATGVGATALTLTRDDIMALLQ